jgi:hypothetical protein
MSGENLSIIAFTHYISKAIFCQRNNISEVCDSVAGEIKT